MFKWILEARFPRSKSNPPSTTPHFECQTNICQPSLFISFSFWTATQIMKHFVPCQEGLFHSLVCLLWWAWYWLVLFHEPASDMSMIISSFSSGSSNSTWRWFKCYLESGKERLWHLKTVPDNCEINPRQTTLSNHFITGLNKLIFEIWSSWFCIK